MTRQSARMTNKMERDSVIEHALGSLGLLLIALIGWAVERQQSTARVDVILGRLILQCVSAIGWIVDRGPWPTPYRRDRESAVYSFRR